MYGGCICVEGESGWVYGGWVWLCGGCMVCGREASCLIGKPPFLSSYCRDQDRKMVLHIWIHNHQQWRLKMLNEGMRMVPL